MHRLGFKGFELDQLSETLSEKNLKVQSIFSHLSSSDLPEEKEFTLDQLKTFDKNSSHLIENWITPLSGIF